MNCLTCKKPSTSGDFCSPGCLMSAATKPGGPSITQIQAWYAQPSFSGYNAMVDLNEYHYTRIMRDHLVQTGADMEILENKHIDSIVRKYEEGVMRQADMMQHLKVALSSSAGTSN